MLDLSADATVDKILTDEFFTQTHISTNDCLGV